MAQLPPQRARNARQYMLLWIWGSPTMLLVLILRIEQQDYSIVGLPQENSSMQA